MASPALVPDSLIRVDLGEKNSARGWAVVQPCTVYTYYGEVEAQPGDLLLMTAEKPPRVLLIAGMCVKGKL